MVNQIEFIGRHEANGMKTEQGFEKPGVKYSRYAHEKTALYTTSGKLTLTLYNSVPPEVVELRPGSEVVIEEGVDHSAVVGETGWGYVAAWDPEAAKKYKGAH
ncbi:MAG: hypothetical protein AAB624_00855 [Patescibacteria group bacterium]